MIPIFDSSVMRAGVGFSAVALATTTYKKTPPEPENGHPREAILMSTSFASNSASMHIVQISVTPGVSGYAAQPGAVIMLR
jgi:hypothetical protein